MEFVTSRNIALPDTSAGLEKELWFNLWSKKRWPYNELENGDMLYWYHSPSSRIVWRSRVVTVSRFPYLRKDEVRQNLQLGAAQTAEPYFVDAPESGFCLAYRVHALERISIPKPLAFRFPQNGWLKLKHDVTGQWPGLAASPDATLPKYREIELPLLVELIRRGGSAAPADQDGQGRTIYAALADLFGLSQVQRTKTTEDGEGRIHWEKMVRWARQKLLDKGLLTSNQSGNWAVTAEGREFAGAELAAAHEATKNSDAFFPEEVAGETDLIEGAIQRVSVNAYERNVEARRRCIAHYGAICCICQFSFADAYGDAFKDFIHVHHLRALSEIGGEYKVNPIKDLRPVCPNCHVIVHRRTPAYSIEDVRQFLQKCPVKAVEPTTR